MKHMHNLTSFILATLLLGGWTSSTNEQDPKSSILEDNPPQNDTCLDNSTSPVPTDEQIAEMVRGAEEFVDYGSLSYIQYDETYSIGLSVRGSKDVQNFRENVEMGFLPQKSDLTYEGLFYNYSFDTGASDKELEVSR